MGKKRDKANENILELIDMLVSTEEIALGEGNCPYYAEKVRPCSTYESQCGWCKEVYFDTRKENLEKKYVVN